MRTTGQKQFGQYLKSLRIERGLSLREVEREVGLSNSYIYQIEIGERNPPKLDILAKFARLYRVTLAQLAEVAQIEGVPDADEEKKRILVENAFDFVRRDPSYRYGTQVVGDDLTIEAKRFVVEMYEKATGRNLLGSITEGQMG